LEKFPVFWQAFYRFDRQGQEKDVKFQAFLKRGFHLNKITPGEIEQNYIS